MRRRSRSSRREGEEKGWELGGGGEVGGEEEKEKEKEKEKEEEVEKEYRFPPNIKCADGFSNHPPLQHKQNMLETSNLAW